ncbi:hypothetical protein A2U01_0061334, partial [Trifolium medium]|nr:hypothetical protein [Trifolium medium]
MALKKVLSELCKADNQPRSPQVETAHRNGLERTGDESA